MDTDAAGPKKQGKDIDSDDDDDDAPRA